MLELLYASAVAVPLLISEVLAPEEVTPGELMGPLVVCADLKQTKNLIGHLAEGTSISGSVAAINAEQASETWCATDYYVYDVESFEPEIIIELDGDPVAVVSVTLYATFDPETYEEAPYAEPASVHTALYVDELISMELDLQIMELLKEAVESELGSE